MKVEARLIPGLAEGLAALLAAKLPKAQAFALARFAVRVRETAVSAEEIRTAALKRLGKPTNTGGYVFETGEAAAEFAAEMEEAAKAKVELPDVSLKLSEIPEEVEKIGLVLLNLQPILSEE